VFSAEEEVEQRFEVSLRARNELGWSRWSVPATLSPERGPPAAPGRPHRLWTTNDTLAVAWTSLAIGEVSFQLRMTAFGDASEENWCTETMGGEWACSHGIQLAGIDPCSCLIDATESLRVPAAEFAKYGGGSETALANSAHLSGISPATEHAVDIRARNAAGWSVGWSPVLRLETLDTPRTPTSVSAAPGSIDPASSMDVAWSPPAYDGGLPVLTYELCIEEEEVGGSRNGTGATMTTFVPFSQLNHTRGGLSPGAEHRARVRAQNELGWSEWSSPWATATLFPLPPAPPAPRGAASSREMSKGAVAAISTTSVVSFVAIAYGAYQLVVVKRLGVRAGHVRRAMPGGANRRMVTEAELVAMEANLVSETSMTLNPTFAGAIKSEVSAPRSGIARLGIGGEETVERKLDVMAQKLIRDEETKHRAQSSAGTSQNH